MKQLRNFTEDEVTQYVDNALPKLDICQCESCRLDIMAIMLNKLPPRYVVTEKGALYAQLSEFDFQHRADFVKHLTEAIKIVKQHPNH